MDRSHEAANETERLRLQSLANTWSNENLARPMPAGWTVAAVLAHIAFWDARAILWLDRWAAGEEPVAPEYETLEEIDWINDSAKPLCVALAPREAANLALRLAEETDAKVAAIPDDLLSKVVALGCPFSLSRAGHRREHLDDIEALFGPLQAG